MAIKKPNPTRPALDFTGILRGTALAAVTSVIGAFLLGVIYHFTGIADSTLPLAASVILLAGVFSGGFSAARRSGTKGLFHGLGVGLLVFILIWIFMGLFLPGGVLLVPLAQKLFICLIGGSLGGVLGIVL
ncbi:MAG: TIGR04086 family membrane protein [Desulfocucumaceae bacterium]